LENTQKSKNRLRAHKQQHRRVFEGRQIPRGVFKNPIKLKRKNEREKSNPWLAARMEQTGVFTERAPPPRGNLSEVDGSESKK